MKCKRSDVNASDCKARSRIKGFTERIAITPVNVEVVGKNVGKRT